MARDTWLRPRVANGTRGCEHESTAECELLETRLLRDMRMRERCEALVCGSRGPGLLVARPGLWGPSLARRSEALAARHESWAARR